jgi:mitotic spindle assembly checkpoint protein MAD1
MIVRTPPAKKRRGPENESPPPAPAAGPLVIYEDHPSPSPLQPTDDSSHHMLCTYQCRQMVFSLFSILGFFNWVDSFVSRTEMILNPLII